MWCCDWVGLVGWKEKSNSCFGNIIGEKTANGSADNEWDCENDTTTKYSWLVHKKKIIINKKLGSSDSALPFSILSNFFWIIEFAYYIFKKSVSWKRKLNCRNYVFELVH